MKKIVLLTLLMVVTIRTDDAHLYHPIDYRFARKQLPINRDWQLRSMISGGVTNAHAYLDGKRQDSVFNLWNKSENTLAMLEGFNAATSAGQLLNALNAADDGIRGQILLSAELQMPVSAFVGFSWRYAANFFLDIGLPFFYQRLSDIAITDLTFTFTPDDQRVRSLLTNNLSQIAKQIGGLELNGWQRAGIGDISVATGWSNTFVQHRSMLKSVGVALRVGIGLPTGKRTDIDHLLAESFGNDGSASLFFDGGLALNLTDYLLFGADLSVTHIFGNTRSRRIKTSKKQTEFLLLQKTQAYKDYGMEQNFDLYLQLHNADRQFFCKLIYTYYKHGDDKLSLPGQVFDARVANTALSLEERTAHQFMVNVGLNAETLWPTKKGIPSIDLFAALPFNGNNSLTVPQLGISFNTQF